MNLNVKEFARVLKECGNQRDFLKAKHLHKVILRNSEFNHNKYLANLVIEMYGKCGSLEDCLAAFYEIERPNVFSWCILLSAYASNGHLQQAKAVFDLMPEVNIVAWTSLLKSYADNGLLHEAERMFCEIKAVCNLVCWNCMLAAYAQHNRFEKMDSIFSDMPARDLISWNSVLWANAEFCGFGKTKTMFDAMPEWDIISYNVMLLAHTHTGHINDVESLFAAMPERDLVGYSQVIAVHIVHKDLDRAKLLFDQMPERDVISSTRLLQGYVESRDFEAATDCFNAMHQLSVPSYNLMNGHLGDAREMLERMPERNVVAWTAMISSYAHNGYGRLAISMFREMEVSGEEANEVTILGVLLACNHKGMLVECLGCFKGIKEDYGVTMVVDHYLAMVVVLGRLGHAKIARDLLNSMPFIADNPRSWEIFLRVFVPPLSVLEWMRSVPEQLEDLFSPGCLEAVGIDFVELGSLG
ncbi:pentatricopeptide repeat-containing protein At2g35030, mitochondrial-like [Selaginella moellendorffii]|uniref:pentatricopeptide repeat-containing protein At2g35030, mitochondrial-like n=1 Tax=Selaginella moellendorffii TaxID=88036 RepID=UPI000D1C800C|nr:pentatricopeptide repeat-containing protein At2g35030, mitochondrial-like [Selaginella moellendorffii]|eukprot:XP_024524492.1 pentatricopeptide repeat-containing protein At2g35030, mitochondrial-like [Selaginella moellendorffii]